MTAVLCGGSGWGMYPSNVAGDVMMCPLCEQSVPAGWMDVAGRRVRLIKDHPPCR